MNYQEAIRIAEERERKLKEAFDRSDHDKGGTIDMEEILPLLDDLGLVKRLKTDRIEFCTKMFLREDADCSGSLSFEEFKGFFNAAIDDCAGKKPKPKVKRVGSSTIDPEQEAARAKVAEDRARKKAEESERIRLENAEMKAKIAAANKSKDAKALDSEVLKARKAALEERARKKAEEGARIAAENKAMRAKIKGAKAKVDDDVEDDLVDIDGDGVADMTAGELRKRQAAEKKAARDSLTEEHQQNARDLSEMKKNAVAKVDDDVEDDLVDIDGDGIADMTAGELRKRQAAEKKVARDSLTEEHKRNARDLSEMKKNAVAKVDVNVEDDLVDIDGDGVADMTAGELRKQLAAEKKAARDSLTEEHKQNARDLSEMMANATSRTDHDISDDPAGFARAEIAALKQELGQ